MSDLPPGFADSSRGVPVSLHAHGDRVYLGIVNRLLMLDQAKEPVTMSFSLDIRSLTCWGSRTQTRVAATFPHGCALVWHDSSGCSTEFFASGVSNPTVGFNRLGDLVVASAGAFQVYSTRNRRLTLVAESSRAYSEPIAVLPAPSFDQFALVSDSGQVKVFELP